MLLCKVFILPIRIRTDIGSVAKEWKTFQYVRPTLRPAYIWNAKHLVLLLCWPSSCGQHHFATTLSSSSSRMNSEFKRSCLIPNCSNSQCIFAGCSQTILPLALPCQCMHLSSPMESNGAGTSSKSMSLAG